MRLTAHLVARLMLVIVALLGLDMWITVQRETALFDRTIERDTLRLGRAVRDLLGDIRSASGDARARQALAEIDRVEAHWRLRWLTLNELPGAIRADVTAGRETLQRGGLEGGETVTVFLGLPGTSGEVLEVRASLAERDAYIRESVNQGLMLLGALALTGLLVVLFLGVGLIGRPVSELVDKLGRLQRGDTDRPIPAGGLGELGLIAARVNEACAAIAAYRQAVTTESSRRIEAMEQLRHADRLQTIGQLASSIAHELGTPLNVIDARAAMILEDRSSNTGQDAKTIREQCARMTTAIRRLLDFARRKPAARRATALLPLVQRSVDLLEPLARKRGVSLIVRGADAPQIQADPDLIEQALSNLVVNALQASPAGGTVTVAVEGPGTVSVTDGGPGITDDVRDRLFEPFFTTKPAGAGTGLGLAIAQGIVSEHGGRLEVEASPGGGARFVIVLQEGADG